jgi:hypothetical protein
MALLLRHDGKEGGSVRSVGDPPHGVVGVDMGTDPPCFRISGTIEPPDPAKGELIRILPDADYDDLELSADEVVAACEDRNAAIGLWGGLITGCHFYLSTFNVDKLPAMAELAVQYRDALAEHDYLKRVDL